MLSALDVTRDSRPTESPMDRLSDWLRVSQRRYLDIRLVTASSVLAVAYDCEPHPVVGSRIVPVSFGTAETPMLAIEALAERGYQGGMW